MATRGVVARDVCSAWDAALFPSNSERGVQPGAVKSGCCDMLESCEEFAPEGMDSLGFTEGTSIVTGVKPPDVRNATCGEDGLLPGSGA